MLPTIGTLFCSAGTYPRPCDKVNSIDKTASGPNVAICRSGFKISTSESVLISPATTLHSPAASIQIVLASSEYNFARMDFTFRTISVTSSFTPGIVANSCCTPSILMKVTAVPGSDDSSMRRIEFPKTLPCPSHSGSIMNLP